MSETKFDGLPAGVPPTSWAVSEPKTETAESEETPPVEVETPELPPIPPPRPNQVGAHPSAPPPSGTLGVQAGRPLAARAELELRLTPEPEFTEPPEIVPSEYGGELLADLEDLFSNHVELDAFQPEIERLLNEVDLSTLTETDLRAHFNDFIRDHRLAAPDPIEPLPAESTVFENDLVSVEDGARQAHFDVLNVVLFGASADVPAALQSYSESVAALSSSARTWLGDNVDPVSSTTLFPIALPGLFIPPGSQIDWDGEQLVASSPGILALVGNDTVAVTQVSLNLSDAQNSFGFSVYQQDEDSLFALAGFQATSAGDGSASLFSADALAYYDGGNHLVFTGIQGGHNGDQAGLFAAGIDVEVGDTEVSGVGGYITQDPDAVNGGLSNAVIRTNGFDLTADQLVFTRAGDEDSRSFTGVATGDVSLALGSDFTTESDRLIIDMTEVGEQSTLTIALEGPTEGTISGSPFSASDGLTVESTVVGEDLTSLEARYAGDLRYVFGDSESDDPVLTSTAGTLTLTPETLSFSGERIGYQDGEDFINGERLTASYQRVGEDGTDALTINGWEDGPSSVDAKLDSLSLGTQDLEELTLVRSTETGRFVSGSFVTNGGELSDDGENPFTLTSTGRVNANFATHDSDGVLSLVQVNGEDFAYRDPDWAVDLTDGAGGEIRFTENGDLSYFGADVGTGRFTSQSDRGTPFDLQLSGGNNIELNYLRNDADELEAITFGGNLTRADLLASEDGTGFVDMASAEGRLYPDGSIQNVLLSVEGGQYRDPDGGVFEIADGHVFLSTSAPGQLAEFDAGVSALSVATGDYTASGTGLFASGTFGDTRDELAIGGESARYASQIGTFRELGIGEFSANLVQDRQYGAETLSFSGTDISGAGRHGDADQYGFRFALPGLTEGTVVTENGALASLTLGTGPLIASAYEGSDAAVFGFGSGVVSFDPYATAADVNDLFLSFGEVADIDWARNVDMQIGSVQFRGDDVVTSLTLQDAVASGVIDLDDEWREANLDLDLIQVEILHSQGTADTIIGRAGNGDIHIEGIGDVAIRMPDGELVETRLDLEEDRITLGTGRGELRINTGSLEAHLRGELLGLELSEPGVIRFTGRQFDVGATEGPLGGQAEGRTLDLRLDEDGITLEHAEGVTVRLWDHDNQFVSEIEITAEMIRNARVAFGEFDERISGERIRGLHLGFLPSAQDSEVTVRFTAETEFGDAYVDVQNASEAMGTALVRTNYAQLSVSAPGGYAKIDLGGILSAEGRDGAVLAAGVDPVNVERFVRTLFDLQDAAAQNTDGGFVMTRSVIGYQFGGERFRIGPMAAFGLQRIHGGPPGVAVNPFDETYRLSEQDYFFNPFDLRALGVAVDGAAGALRYSAFAGLTDATLGYVQGADGQGNPNLKFAGLDVPGGRLQVPLAPTLSGDLFFGTPGLQGVESLQIGGSYALSPLSLVDSEFIDEPNQGVFQVRAGIHFQNDLSIVPHYTQSTSGDQQGYGVRLQKTIGSHGQLSARFDRFGNENQFGLQFSIPLGGKRWR